jgi:hypothetical protein
MRKNMLRDFIADSLPTADDQLRPKCAPAFGEALNSGQNLASGGLVVLLGCDSQDVESLLRASAAGSVVADAERTSGHRPNVVERLEVDPDATVRPVLRRLGSAPARSRDGA